MGGRCARLASLVDEVADLDSTVTHFNKAVTDTELNFLASNAVRGSPGLPLSSLIFVTEDET